MRSRGLSLALCLALLSVSCTEPTMDLPVPEGDAVEAYRSDPELRRKVDDLIRDHPQLAEDYAEKFQDGLDEADAGSGDGEDGLEGAAPSRRSGRGIGPPGTSFMLGLGGGGVLVVLILLLVRMFRRTGLSADLAIRSSRRRYLARCREAARRRGRGHPRGMAGHGVS